MDSLQKLNSLIAQADERISQIDESNLNENELKMVQEIKSKYPQQAAIAIAKKEAAKNK
jgi:hypothetical protein